MWKRVLALSAGLWGCIAAAVNTPIMPINVNFELPTAQYDLRLRALNTPCVRAFLFNGTNAFDPTGYGAYLAWGKDAYASNMVYVTGTTYSAGYVDFNVSSNDLAYPVTKWYSAVMLTYPASGKVYSVGQGYMTVLPSPEVSSTGILLRRFAINGSEYGPFTGSFTNWPFALKDDYVGGYVSVETYNAGTGLLWQSVFSNSAAIAAQSVTLSNSTQHIRGLIATLDAEKLAITTWSNSAAYGVTAAHTAQWATAYGWGNWATNGLLSSASLAGLSNNLATMTNAFIAFTNDEAYFRDDIYLALMTESGRIDAAVAVSASISNYAYGLSNTWASSLTALNTATNALNTSVAALLANMTVLSNYVDASDAVLQANINASSNASDAADALLAADILTTSNSAVAAIGELSNYVDSQDTALLGDIYSLSNDVAGTTGDVANLKTATNVFNAWGDHSQAGYLTAGTNRFDRVYAATLGALTTNYVASTSVYVGSLTSVAYTNEVELVLGKTYAWGFNKVNANGTSTLSLGTASLLVTNAGAISNYFVCTFTNTSMVLTLDGTGDSKSDVSNMYVCAVTQGAVSAASDLYVGGEAYFGGVQYTNPAAQILELQTATNDIHVRLQSVETATTNLDWDIGAVQTNLNTASQQLSWAVGTVQTNLISTNAALTNRLVALDHSDTGAVVVLRTATNALNTRLAAGPTNWSEYPAVGNVDFRGYVISNVTEITSMELGVPVLTENFTQDVFTAGTWTNVDASAWNWEADEGGIIYGRDGGIISNATAFVVGRQYRVVIDGEYGWDETYTNEIDAIVAGESISLTNGTRSRYVTTNDVSASGNGITFGCAAEHAVHYPIIHSIVITDITPSNSVAIARLSSDQVTLGGVARTNWPTDEIVTIGADATTAGKAYVLAAGVWTNACATNEAMASGLLGIALGDDSGDGIRIYGPVSVASNDLAVGGSVFIAPTAGAWTQAAPTNSGYSIRAIGYATATNVVFIAPDAAWGTVQ